jgi:hypothetical protein
MAAVSVSGFLTDVSDVVVSNGRDGKTREDWKRFEHFEHD